MDPCAKAWSSARAVRELVLGLGENRRSWSSPPSSASCARIAATRGQAALGSGAAAPARDDASEHPQPRRSGAARRRAPAPLPAPPPEAGRWRQRSRGRGDGLDERRIPAWPRRGRGRRRVSVVHERRDRPPRAGLRELDRPAGVIDVALLLGERVAEDERPVAERPTKLVPEGPRVGPLAEVDHEIGDDGLRPAPAEQVDEEHDGERRNHDVVRQRAARSASQPASRSTAPKASTAANASAARAPGCPARRAVPRRGGNSRAAAATSAARTSVRTSFSRDGLRTSAST